MVEGRDDTAAIKRAVDAETIETHGFGMSDEMWKRIETAYNSQGIIVFTDPDSAGARIRRKITERFPDAAQAYLPKDKALKGDNIGVENAKPEDIEEALSKTHYTEKNKEAEISIEDLNRVGLNGGQGSRVRRGKVCEILGIGYCNSKTMLMRLNAFGISREDFYGAVQSINN